VRENAFNELRLLDARDHVQAPTAAHALLDLDPKHPFQAPRPVHTNIPPIAAASRTSSTVTVPRRLRTSASVLVGTAYFWWRRGILGMIVSGTVVLLALKIGVGW
jgi:hypothetical protein